MLHFKNYNKKFISKGAMFGLDARIALAIFGALSVISGAALYSAIQESKVTAVITELDELTKASEQYLLDTGSYLTSVINDDNLKISELLEDSGNANWQGPYISGYVKNAEYPDRLLFKGGYKYYLLRAVDADWGSFTSAHTKCSKTTSGPCSVWVGIMGSDLAIYKKIEEKIDGTVNPGESSFTGNVRYNNESVHIKKYVYDKTQAID